MHFHTLLPTSTTNVGGQSCSIITPGIQSSPDSQFRAITFGSINISLGRAGMLVVILIVGNCTLCSLTDPIGSGCSAPGRADKWLHQWLNEESNDMLAGHFEVHHVSRPP